MNLEGSEFIAWREQLANGCGFARQHGGDRSLEHTGFAALFRGAADDGERQSLLHLGNDNSAQFGVGLDDEPAGGRFKCKPAAQARCEECMGGAEFARFAGQVDNHMVDGHLRA